MSDQMITFNGFPFLEKEDKEDDDHAYFEPSTCTIQLNRTTFAETGLSSQS